MPRLALAKDLSVAEQRQLISWQDPPAWSAAATNDAPPGRGNFMIKIGGRPGIPFRVTLTEAEERLHDTNKLWHEQSRRGEFSAHATRRDVGRDPGGLRGWAPGGQARDRPLDALAAADGHARARRLAAVAGEAAAQAGAAIDHWRHRPPVDPLALVLELADGRTHWPPAGTPILIAAAAACALLVTAGRARSRTGGR